MDLAIAVGLCNCTLAIGCLAIALWVRRFHRQVVALKNCCDRWTIDCDRLLSTAPESLVASTAQIHNLRHIYQQQLVTIERMRAIGLLLRIVGIPLLKRRYNVKG